MRRNTCIRTGEIKFNVRLYFFAIGCLFVLCIASFSDADDASRTTGTLTLKVRNVYQCHDWEYYIAVHRAEEPYQLVARLSPDRKYELPEGDYKIYYALITGNAPISEFNSRRIFIMPGKEIEVELDLKDFTAQGMTIKLDSERNNIYITSGIGVAYGIIPVLFGISSFAFRNEDPALDDVKDLYGKIFISAGAAVTLGSIGYLVFNILNINDLEDKLKAFEKETSFRF